MCSPNGSPRVALPDRISNSKVSMCKTTSQYEMTIKSFIMHYLVYAMLRICALDQLCSLTSSQPSSSTSSSLSSSLPSLRLHSTRPTSQWSLATLATDNCCKIVVLRAALVPITPDSCTAQTQHCNVKNKKNNTFSIGQKYDNNKRATFVLLFAPYRR